MTSNIATIAFAIGIAALFYLDRDPKARTSKALWIPVVWLLINGSRPASFWLQTTATVISSPDQYLDGSPVDARVWGILLLAGVIVLIGRRKRIGTLLGANAPILLFFGYCALSILWSDYPFVALKRWTKAVGDVVMILIVVSDLNWFAAVKRFLARTSFVLIPLSVLFIKYRPDLGRAYNVWTWQPEYVGITTTKNMLGMICLICGVASAWRLTYIVRARINGERRRQLLAHSIILLMVIWLLRIADSMTSLSCFLMASVLIVATSSQKVAHRRILVHFLVATVGFISVFALFVAPVLLEALGRNPTLTGRTEIWKAVLAVSGNPLIGTGFESFWLGPRLQKVWDMTARGIQEAHNGYLEVYLNLGWVGISLVVVILAKAYTNALDALCRKSGIGVLALAYLVVGIIYNFTEAGFRMMAPVWITFLLGAIAISKNASELDNKATHSVSLRVRTPLVVPTLLGDGTGTDRALADHPDWLQGDLDEPRGRRV
jgi:O-antigen ligase